MLPSPLALQVQPNYKDFLRKLYDLQQSFPVAIQIDLRNTDPDPVDVTNPHFEYVPGESAFELLAEGSRVASGDGADYVDPHGTKTFFGRV